MSEFTTIQIKKSLRDKLDLVKGENNLSYNQIVEKLLQQSGGVIVEDTIEVGREQVALSLKYWDNLNRTKVTDITYGDLANTVVGMTYVAEEFPDTDLEFINSTAKVMANDGSDVILLVEESSCRKGKVSSIKSVVHICLF